MLRPNTIEQLRKYLDNPPLLIPEDFSLEVTEEKAEVVLKIRYQAGSDEYFLARIPRQKTPPESSSGAHNTDFRISCVFEPGELSRRESTIVWGLSRLTYAVGEWAGRVAEDIRKGAAYRAIQENERRLAELETQVEQIPNEYATAEQVQKLHEWLNEVEAELRRRVEQLELDSKAKNARIEEMHSMLEALRERTPTMPLRSWFRAFVARVAHIGSDPRTGQLLENGAKLAGLLGSGHK